MDTDAGANPPPYPAPPDLSTGSDPSGHVASTAISKVPSPEDPPAQNAAPTLQIHRYTAAHCYLHTGGEPSEEHCMAT